jgi:hypothetical protein
MPPWMPDSNDQVTSFLVKNIVFPFIIVVLSLMLLDTQINQWKCTREAKRQGYLEGEFYPAYRFTSAKCILRKQVRPDGTIDSYATKVIDLQNQKLKW